VLIDHGEAVGYVATVVEPMWSPSHPFRQQEQVWLLVSWIDGSRERIFEDYPPWTAVEELRHGHFVWESPDGEIDLEASWLTGEERDHAWARYGILHDVSAYLTPQGPGNAAGEHPDVRSRYVGAVWTGLRRGWQARLERRRRRRFYGRCPSCRHDWREHHPRSGCGECQYEIDHDEPGAPASRCLAAAPGYTFES